MADEEDQSCDTLAEITAVSLERSTLEPRELMLARIAALAAVDAPPASYLLNAGTAMDVGITLEDVQGILVAVAPIVGTPRVVGGNRQPRQRTGFRPRTRTRTRGRGRSLSLSLSRGERPVAREGAGHRTLVERTRRFHSPARPFARIPGEVAIVDPLGVTSSNCRFRWTPAKDPMRSRLTPP